MHTRSYWNIDELVTYLDEQYGVIYQSKQSYYELLSAANISWKKSQKINPKSDSDFVKKKREEIIDFWSKNQTEIQAGRLVVFFVDECHLLGDDVCGYVWGPTDTRVEIPVKNIKDRQTYYGALDAQTKEFLIREYSTGNGESTVEFIKYLQSQRSGQRILLIWDGASTARRKSKVKSQKSKVLWNGLFRDFKWLPYLRRSVLVIIGQMK